ncbi:hypothetical protein DPEC_G00003970 [Dallia pectoralis]|uniref:Uncharacterized protein n=1 Tax=Dallia pectoralis TaxID=75939 RepID=A0ACC2HJI4_DALPE|nr:hypothetical protein DPEC_G00003970 [Dallia pectoralis]
MSVVRQAEDRSAPWRLSLGTLAASHLANGTAWECICQPPSVCQAVGPERHPSPTVVSTNRAFLQMWARGGSVYPVGRSGTASQLVMRLGVIRAEPGAPERVSGESCS